MYKDEGKQKEANRERQRRYKEKQKALLSEGVTWQGVTKFPSLILALADPVKFDKIERILASLKRHSGVKLENIWYGVYGPTFKSIDNLLSGNSKPSIK